MSDSRVLMEDEKAEALDNDLLMLTPAELADIPSAIKTTWNDIVENSIGAWEAWREYFVKHYYAPREFETAEEAEWRKILLSVNQPFPLKVSPQNQKLTDKLGLAGVPFSTERPRILTNVQTPFVNDAKEYYQLLQQVIDGKMLVSSNLIFKLALVALANLHHIKAWVAQRHCNKDGLVEHIRKEVRKNCSGDLKFLDSVMSSLSSQFDEFFLHMKDESHRLRRFYKKSLPCDYANSDLLKKYREQGFAILEVKFVPNDITQGNRTTKNLTMPENFKTVKTNTVVVDHESKKVLGIYKQNAIDAEMQKRFADAAADAKVKQNSIWNMSARPSKATTTQQGNQTSIGVIRSNYNVQNALSTATNRYKPFLPLVSELGVKMGEIFKELLPTTYQSELDELKDLGPTNNLLAAGIPFSVASINLTNMVRPHRDNNALGFSAMYVTRMPDAKAAPSQAPLKGGTCFLEWFDLETGLPIEFICAEGSVLIADTDDLHSARNVDEGRISAVFYSNKLLMTPVTLCEVDRSRAEGDEKSVAALIETRKRKQRADAAVVAAPVAELTGESSTKKVKHSHLSLGGTA